ncbi:CD59 glycoprotein-like [Actinia tenebrosa]|uniref:CD59 glycoprotein-like n=1 Tax=Actinia tenebrosa TaxID=6105 RepID=A0A6P8HMU1_ACTTE|nr:CD59 glycoprotein-like [Actinia tenebrosa]
MQYVFLTLVFLVAVIPSGFSLQCYHCDKEQNCTVTNCSGQHDTCFYTFSKYGASIKRGCEKNTTCNGTANTCEENNLCVMKCCQTDLCNEDGPTMAPPTKAAPKPTRQPAVINSPTTPNTAFQPITSKTLFAVTMVTILMSVL